MLTDAQIQALDHELDRLTPTYPVDLNDIDTVGKIVRTIVPKPNGDEPRYVLDVHHRIRELVIEIHQGSSDGLLLQYERRIVVQGAPAGVVPPVKAYRYASRAKKSKR